MTSQNLRSAHTLVARGDGYGDAHLLDLRTGPRTPLPHQAPLRRVQRNRLGHVRAEALLADNASGTSPGLHAGQNLTVVQANAHGMDLVVLLRPTLPFQPQCGFILTLRRSVSRTAKDDQDRATLAMLRTVPGLWRDSHYSNPDPQGAAARRAVLVNAILDPDAWLSSRDRTSPTPGTPEAVAALRDMLGWASLGLEHEWEARRWRRYQVRTPEVLSNWREHHSDDDDIRDVAPHIPVPNASLRFQDLPVNQRYRWYRTASAAGRLAPMLIEHGWRPGDVARVIHAIDYVSGREPGTSYGDAGQSMIAALGGEPGMTGKVAAAAIAAGLSTEEIVAAHRSGALDGSTVDVLAVMAALRT